MRSVRFWVWSAPTVLYALFWLWYTPLSGPMTQSEIDEAVVALEQGGAAPEAVTRIRNFFESDDGKPFIMVNIIDLADDPVELPATGQDAGAEDLMAHYMEYNETLRTLQRWIRPELFGTRHLCHWQLGPRNLWQKNRKSHELP